MFDITGIFDSREVCPSHHYQRSCQGINGRGSQANLVLPDKERCCQPWHFRQCSKKSDCCKSWKGRFENMKIITQNHSKLSQIEQFICGLGDKFLFSGKIFLECLFSPLQVFGDILCLCCQNVNHQQKSFFRNTMTWNITTLAHLNILEPYVDYLPSKTSNLFKIKHNSKCDIPLIKVCSTETFP